MIPAIANDPGYNVRGFSGPRYRVLDKKITANFIRLEIPKTRSVTYLDPGFYFVEGGRSGV